MKEHEARNLKDVLVEFRDVTAHAGAVKTRVDRKALEQRLGLVERRCVQQHMIWLVILAVAFVFAVVVVWIFLDEPKHAAAVLAATGFTVGAILPKLREAEREIARVRLFIALAASLSDAQLPGIVTALAARL